MKIHVEEHYGEFWAFDDDTYDGAPDAHCPVGVGLTDYSAINDLMEQVIDEIEERLENVRYELDCVKAENKALRSTSAQNPSETSRQDARGDLQIQKEYHHSGLLDQGHGEAAAVFVTPEMENAHGFQRRMADEPDEPAHWDSGYDAKEYDRE